MSATYIFSQFGVSFIHGSIQWKKNCEKYFLLKPFPIFAMRTANWFVVDATLRNFVRGDIIRHNHIKCLFFFISIPFSPKYTFNLDTVNEIYISFPKYFPVKECLLAPLSYLRKYNSNAQYWQQKLHFILWKRSWNLNT